MLRIMLSIHKTREACPNIKIISLGFVFINCEMARMCTGNYGPPNTKNSVIKGTWYTTAKGSKNKDLLIIACILNLIMYKEHLKLLSHNYNFNFSLTGASGKLMSQRKNI